MTPRSVAKPVGRFAIGLLGCIAALALGSYLRSEQLLRARVEPPSPIVERFSHAGSLARGRHLVEAVLQCGHCHGADLGGAPVVDDPLLGRLHAPNLTRGQGGFAAIASDSDWQRAIRFGLRRDGTTLVLQPSIYHGRLSDEDLASVVAWLRAAPPVDRTSPERVAGWGIRVALALGLAHDLLSARAVAAHPPRPITASAALDPAVRGADLVDLANCRVCHHADLAGGLHPLAFPGEPVPPDLRPGGALEGWTRTDFARALREGCTPDGRTLDPEFMPWPRYAHLTDAELDALWHFLSEAQSTPGVASPP